jgi:hypothetical protein
MHDVKIVALDRSVVPCERICAIDACLLWLCDAATRSDRRCMIGCSEVPVVDTRCQLSLSMMQSNPLRDAACILHTRKHGHCAARPMVTVSVAGSNHVHVASTQQEARPSEAQEQVGPDEQLSRDVTEPACSLRTTLSP